MSVIPAALDLVEDVLLPALRRAMPAWWGVAPVGTVERLLKEPSDAAYLQRCLVGQLQAAGRPDPLIGSAGWAGPVVMRCLSADAELARAGRDAGHSALASIVSPAGYAVRLRYTSPVLGGRDPDGIYTAASQYEVVIRRVPV